MFTIAQEENELQSISAWTVQLLKGLFNSFAEIGVPIRRETEVTGNFDQI